MNESTLVIGGGICGLLTAHALARQGLHVTLAERGTYPSMKETGAPPARAGVPQSHCLHMLMSGGAAVFDDIVPGWRDRLAECGATPFDAMADAETRFPAGWITRVPSGLNMYACSRSLLEQVLLDLTADVPNVDVLSPVSVVGLLHDEKQNRVIGVRTSDRDIPAELVVDASGTASHMRKWLTELPGQKLLMPQETVIPSPWQYVSQWWWLPTDRSPVWSCLSIAPHPKDAPLAGMMLRAERDYWNVVLLAGSGQTMPGDTASFLRFAAEVGEGDLAKTLAVGKPVTPVHPYGRTANRLRHWGRLADMPNGLAILGDAAMTLDPYRGLGMTAASISVQLLARRLKRQGISGFRTCEFQKELAQIQKGPWRVVTGHDTEGGRDDRQQTQLANLYERAPNQPQAAQAVYEYLHLVRPLDELFGEEAT